MSKISKSLYLDQLAGLVSLSLMLQYGIWHQDIASIYFSSVCRMNNNLCVISYNVLCCSQSQKRYMQGQTDVYVNEHEHCPRYDHVADLRWRGAIKSPSRVYCTESECGKSPHTVPVFGWHGWRICNKDAERQICNNSQSTTAGSSCFSSSGYAYVSMLVLPAQWIKNHDPALIGRAKSESFYTKAW